MQPEPQVHVPPPPPMFVQPMPSYATAVAPPVAADTRARSAAFALLGSAGLVLLALITKSWFTAKSGGYIGPLGVDRCRGLLCQSTSWFDVKHVPPQVPIFATCALLAGLVAAAFMIHTAVMLLQRSPHRVKLRWLAQTLGLAIMSAACFIFSLSVGDWSRGLSIGWSSFVGLGGTIAAGVITATMVRPAVRA